jgi:hypothetical protein
MYISECEYEWNQKEINKEKGNAISFLREGKENRIVSCGSIRNDGCILDVNWRNEYDRVS